MTGERRRDMPGCGWRKVGESAGAGSETADALRAPRDGTEQSRTAAGNGLAVALLKCVVARHERA